MGMTREFLILNPEIANMLDNDNSLKYICTPKELKAVDVSAIKVPILVMQNDMYFDKYDLSSVENFGRYMLILLASGKNKGSLVYKNCNIYQSQVQEVVDKIMLAFEIAQSRYIEYFSAVRGIETRVEMKCLNGMVLDLTIYLSFVENYRGAIKEINEFLQLCEYVKYQLIKSNKINNRMHPYNIAAVLFNWVVLHTRYDMTFKGKSQTGMSALKYGEAVCNGYTALYNCLCKLFGLEVIGMAGTAKPKNTRKVEKHIWTWMKIQGRDIFIDVTWGSPIFMGGEVLKKLGINPDDFCDFNHFDIPLNELRKEHHWKRSIYPI